MILNIFRLLKPLVKWRLEQVIQRLGSNKPSKGDLKEYKLLVKLEEFYNEK